MAVKGHEDQFPPASLNGRYRLVKATFVGIGGKEEDAPKDPMGVWLATGAL